MDKKSKSAAIQHKYRELQLDHSLLMNFQDEDGIYFTGQEQSDELLDLFDELAEKIKNIVENNLTPRQKEVVQMIYYDEMTQTEVAKELDLCQPTV